jgi:hypothetical protein
MRIDFRALAITAVAAGLLGLNPARAESPTILMLNIDKYDIVLKVVDNLSPDKATVFSGTLRPGQESSPFKVYTQPGAPILAGRQRARTTRAMPNDAARSRTRTAAGGSTFWPVAR